MILLLFINALFALTYPLAQTALLYGNMLLLITIRMIGAGVILLAYHRFVARKSLRISKGDQWVLVKIAFCAMYISFILEAWALQRIPALQANLMYLLSPFASALLGYCLAKETLSKKKIVGILIGLIGSVMLIQNDFLQGTISLPGLSGTLSALALLGAMFLGAYSWFLVKDLMKKGHSLILINGLTMLYGGIMSVITLSVTGGGAAVTAWGPFLSYAGILMIMANIVAYNICALLLQRYSLTFIMLAQFTCPIFGALYGYFFWQEPFYSHYVMAFCVIALGVWLFYSEER